MTEAFLHLNLFITMNNEQNTMNLTQFFRALDTDFIV